jgi:hypothetical protein
MTEETADTKVEPKQEPQKRSGIQKFRDSMPKALTDNAPRVVGALKVAGPFVVFAKSDNIIFRTAAALFMLAYSVMTIFGGKKTAEEKEKLRKENENLDTKSIGGKLKRVLKPKQYPIETAETISAFGSLFWIAGGLKYGQKGEDKENKWLRFGAGFASLGSDLNAAFTQERIGDPNANPHKKGSLKYYRRVLKNRPIIVSSSLNILCDLLSIGQGITTRQENQKLKKDNPSLNKEEYKKT